MALPALALGAGASLLGGLFGKSERPTLDPAMLQQMFGAGAIADETSDLYRLLLNSPAFSQINRMAGNRGAQIANATQANLAASGLNTSGIGAHLGAAADQAGSGLQIQGMAQLFGQALGLGAQNVDANRAAYVNSFLQRQSEPTFGRLIGGGLLGAGSSLLSAAALGGGGKGGNSQQFLGRLTPPMY